MGGFCGRQNFCPRAQLNETDGKGKEKRFGQESVCALGAAERRGALRAYSLMKKTFSYLEKDGQYFPVIVISLRHRKKTIRINALVDSGASFSVFRPEIAQYLVIKMERGKKLYLTGIGGRILGYLHTLTAAVDKKTFRLKIVFSPEFNVSFNILGRSNFFLPFFITFNERGKKIILES